MKIDRRAIKMYEDDLFSLQMIAEYFGCSRQWVRKYLIKHGVDTSKRKRDVVCDQCGAEFKKPRAYIRNRIKNYCSPKCYYDAIHNDDYNYSRQGQRIARRTVRECGYVILEDEVVHHVDGNTDNNKPENLMVFRNHSDHMRWHRAGFEESGVKPAWRGKKVERNPVRTVGPSETNTEKVIKTVDDIPQTFRSYSKAEQLGKKK